MSAIPEGRIVVTCGPSYEPIDEVRRITNHSTGKLGDTLSNRLAEAGWCVLCLKGIGATHHGAEHASVERISFSTNDDLLERLQAIPDRENVTAVFHAAALCDFRVKHVTADDGEQAASAKISSRSGDLTLTLEPTRKIIADLRGLFPKAKITGWKYELIGTRDDVIAKGIRQIRENRTDACIVNGSAYGPGFGVVQGDRLIAECETNESLANWLAIWLK